VVNAVTLETERAVMARHAAWGGRLTRIGIERMAPIGPMQGFAPARTVLQYRAIKP
jgi:precorrin-6Y C5,15-methyltransferase (decarboxylating)